MDFSRHLYRFLPHLCALCGNRADHLLCLACQADLPRNERHCHTCALPLPANQPVCGDCLATPKHYQLTVCPLLYQHPVDHLVLRFKKRDPHTWARALLPILATELNQHYGPTQPWPDLLIPVPSHALALLRRGFNQAHALADMLHKTTAIPVAPLVKRHGKVQPQKTLDRKTRFANLRGAFVCRTHLAGETVAVIDDVITTGATAELVSECLLKAGAGKVHIWALARTPKPGH
jgi:ComF family protein